MSLCAPSEAQHPLSRLDKVPILSFWRILPLHPSFWNLQGAVLGKKDPKDLLHQSERHQKRMVSVLLEKGKEKGKEQGMKGAAEVADASAPAEYSKNFSKSRSQCEI